MIQIFTSTQEEIQKAVARESSILGVRTKDNNGDTMLDEIVFDEEYQLSLRDYFLDARGRLIMDFQAYTKNVDPGEVYFDSEDADSYKDFVFAVDLPETFNKNMLVPITTNIKEFIVAYIMYRWLETKMPNIAGVYKLRTDAIIGVLKSLFNARTVLLRRKPSVY